MPEELPKLPVNASVKQHIPLGYSTIFFKKILPRAVEYQLKFHSKKYNKLDYLFAGSKKPISKIITYKTPEDEPDN